MRPLLAGENIPRSLLDWCFELGGLQLPNMEDVIQPLGLPLDEVTGFDRMGSELLLRGGSRGGNRLLETLNSRVWRLVRVGNQGLCETYNQHKFHVVFTRCLIHLPSIRI
jgi:hypothetical protein